MCSSCCGATSSNAARAGGSWSSDRTKRPVTISPSRALSTQPARLRSAANHREKRASPRRARPRPTPAQKPPTEVAPAVRSNALPDQQRGHAPVRLETAFVPAFSWARSPEGQNGPAASARAGARKGDQVAVVAKLPNCPPAVTSVSDMLHRQLPSLRRSRPGFALVWRLCRHRKDGPGRGGVYPFDAQGRKRQASKEW
jgi:hypothetical protein